jgi:hypothetical protein
LRPADLLASGGRHGFLLTARNSLGSGTAQVDPSERSNGSGYSMQLIFKSHSLFL